jgi:outer membrane lipoprotein-sorting protein
MPDRSIITGFLLLCILQVACSQGHFQEMKDPAVFKEKFAAATRKTNTIEAGFIQEKNLSILSEKIITKGKFMFQKENKLRWEYTDPFHYLIILNNGKIFTRDEEKNTTIDSKNNKMFAEINTIILGSVQGNLFNDEKRFLPTFYYDKDGYLVKLKPLMPSLKEFLSEIKIYFDATDFSVRRLIMQESSGDYTKIDFTGKKINIPIPDEKFHIP